jgi:hypothetical protein
MKFGLRDGALSMGIFGALIFVLTTIDPTVRQRVSDLFVSDGMSRWGDRLGDLGGALWTAARTQSIENAPLVVFATVGVLLTVFMLRS